MAGKTVSFNSNCNLSDSYVEEIARWLSCNGEVWGVGPTLLFAAAASMFLYHELQASVFIPGDHPHVSPLEKSLLSGMVVGTLALMVHIWVCLMRFFQYYLDTLIKDSPNVLLEMTTAGLLGSSQPELAALGPLTRFLRQQQPQIHITVCWLLALCYADYIRKHYCTRFNMPYLEQWQADLHEMAGRRARGVLSAAHSFAEGVRQRLRGLAPPPSTNEAHTVTADKRLRAAVSAFSSLCAGRGPCESEVCVHDASPDESEPDEVLQKLRAYIKATRCSCSSSAAGAPVPQRPGAAEPVPTPPATDDSRGCARAGSCTALPSGPPAAPARAIDRPVEQRRSTTF